MDGSAAGPLWRMAALLGALAWLAGCATLTAGGASETPALVVPEPPPRVVVDLPVEAPASPSSSAPEPAAASTPADGVERPDAGRAAAEPAPAAPEPGPAAPAPTPAPPLLLAPAGSAPDAAVVRAALASAREALARIDRAPLTAARRTQHDTARRFLQQAGAALAAGNVVFAHYLGEKADTLIRDLSSR